MDNDQVADLYLSKIGKDGGASIRIIEMPSERSCAKIAWNAPGAAIAFVRVSPMPPDVITSALEQIAEAERNLNLADALFLPLQSRDPIRGTEDN